MGPMMMAALIVTASTVTNLTLDVGLNTMQNWFGTIYTDAFWSRSDKPSEEMLRLAREEQAIDRLLQTSDFGVAQLAASKTLQASR